MLKFVDYLHMTLARPMQAEHDYMLVYAPDAKQLNAVGAGNHLYLTMHYPRSDIFEVVRYDHGEDFTNQAGVVQVAVQRAMLGVRRSFPSAVCVTADWNSLQLAEFIKQVMR
jgi:hypothetical protein|nr:MAG TPA: hypothetical protein [Caudoviricetes sp.]